ncbi:MAG: hypothetical protein NTX50_04165 [Candidatus Sumerlaeota bacterium]|nr:hypothetical protein [Candidatus Sumerlaeota bacterium]
MYNWRKLTPTQRGECLAKRISQKHPWHCPPHEDRGTGAYHLSAACYEHAHFIGSSDKRMSECEARLLKTIAAHTQENIAWSILPNHYHFLIRTLDIKALLYEIGQFHGRSSYDWNGEDGTRGRKVWHNCVERKMRGPRHFWATLNYVHNNPVHHGYAEQWQDWPYGNAREYLEKLGRNEAKRIWRDYPVLDYGMGWDDKDM